MITTTAIPIKEKAIPIDGQYALLAIKNNTNIDMAWFLTRLGNDYYSYLFIRQNRPQQLFLIGTYDDKETAMKMGEISLINYRLNGALPI